MSDPISQRVFLCTHCSGKIMIPKDLPPTSGPCPYCAKEITSPPLEAPPLATEPVRLETRARSAASGRPAAAPSVRNRVPVADRLPRLDARRLVPVGALALVLLAAAAAAIFSMTRTPPAATLEVRAPGHDAGQAREQFLQSGWEIEARAVLEGFLAARTAAEKLPYILNGPQLAEVLEEFYGGTRIDDSDTPAEAFAVGELPMENRQRGIFLLDYERPAQLDFREIFRPFVSAEVQLGLEAPGLLVAHTGEAGNFMSEPLRVRAFFKSTPHGLKLDWETFIQTKYRTFLEFVELPGVGERGVFRVFIVEDAPEPGRDPTGFRTYRVADPANTTDSARIRVKVDSDVGKVLSVINWRGIEGATPKAPTATLELAWSGGASVPFELVIQRFICWEFLGLGGHESPQNPNH
jgi:hypothetical protein